MFTYLSPSDAARAGSSNGRGSIGSRMSSTVTAPAARAARNCASLGWPPVTSPGNGQQALAMPDTAASSGSVGLMQDAPDRR